MCCGRLPEVITRWVRTIQRRRNQGGARALQLSRDGGTGGTDLLREDSAGSRVDVYVYGTSSAGTKYCRLQNIAYSVSAA